jgi:hypothetical protein
MGFPLILLYLKESRNGWDFTIDSRFGPATILEGIDIINVVGGEYPLELKGKLFSVSSVHVNILTVSGKDCETILDRWCTPEENGMFIVKASTYPSKSRSRAPRQSTN